MNKYGGTGTPGVVEGTPLVDPTFTRGEKQTVQCRDPVFAVLFYLQLAIVCGMAAILGPSAVTQTIAMVNNSTNSITTTTTTTTTTASTSTNEGLLVYVLVATGIVSVALSALMLTVMMRMPTKIVEMALIFSTLLWGVWMILAFLGGNVLGGIIGLIFFAISVCYMRAVWSRIPYAASNLLTATTAIKRNCGVVVQAYFFALLAMAWTIIWVFALFGVYWSSTTCTTDANGNSVCTSNPSGFTYTLLILSFYFTHQVLHNSVHVIVSGVMGTWWFAPFEARGCCSSAISDSTIRALTTSFGSICFGSLIVAIIQTLRQLAQQAQDRDGGNILACIAQCILSCIQGVVEYFNRWAYVYVGLYGYSYLEAGRNVITLFKNRGWEVIIADNLVGTALLFMSVAVGILSGIAGMLIGWTSTFGNEGAMFAYGFILGIVLSTIVMGTVGSAVNATIVLFAEAPSEFQQNYPDLSSYMHQAWEAAWPGCLARL